MPAVRALVLSGFESNVLGLASGRLWFCKECDKEPPESLVLPALGERILTGPGPARMRPWWDTRGTGNQSPRRRTPKLSLGSYIWLVQEADISFHLFGSKWEALLVLQGAAILLTTILRATWNSSRSPGNTSSASAREILRRSSTLSRILTSFCGSYCGRKCSPRKPSKTCGRSPIFGSSFSCVRIEFASQSASAPSLTRFVTMS